MSENMEKRIGTLVDTILKDYEGGKDIDRELNFDQPDKDVIVDMLDKIKKLVFPRIL